MKKTSRELTVKLPVEVDEILYEVAEREHLSPNSIMCIAIVKYLDEKLTAYKSVEQAESK